MKVSYQNYRQQKQSSKVMRSYIVQAAAKGATEEELDILCQAYLLEQKYGLAVNSTTERRPPVRLSLIHICTDEIRKQKMGSY